jgi:hypothetical protein
MVIHLHEFMIIYSRKDRKNRIEWLISLIITSNSKELLLMILELFVVVILYKKSHCNNNLLLGLQEAATKE